MAQATISYPNGFGSTEFHVLRPRDGELDSRYLLHYLRQDKIRHAGERKMTGSAGQRRVPSHFLENLHLPLLPLDEQRRIAAVLDQADALRAKRREALARLDELTQSIFLDMFGDPALNSKAWPEELCLGDVADIASGVAVGRKVHGADTYSVPYLAVVNVQDRWLDLSCVKMIEATEAEIERYYLREGDLLLTEGGDPDKLGRGAIWKEEIAGCIHQNHVFRVRLKSDNILPTFLNWIVGSSRGKRYFLRSAKQTTGIASINMTQLRSFPLVEPPIDLQCEFARRVEAVERLKVLYRMHLAEQDALFASLQYRAFRGEL